MAEFRVDPSDDQPLYLTAEVTFWSLNLTDDVILRVILRNDVAYMRGS